MTGPNASTRQRVNSSLPVLAIGLVGCGFIGSRLAQEIQRRFRGRARLIGITDTDRARARKLSKRLRPPVPVLPPAELLRRSQLLVEAASARAVTEWMPKAMARGKAVLVLSTGGLLQRPDLLARARRRGIPVYIPSGAIAGLDGIKAAASGGLRSVMLTTRKRPMAFANSPGVLRRKIRLDRIQRPRVIFSGSARRAASEFPQNINVAATLALAGVGPVRTRVRIIADPAQRDNVHELVASGPFGRLVVRAENRPSEQNPKTSVLAVQSAAATLAQILDSVKVGT